MKLLQHSWSDMLVLDHIHQRMHNSLPDETTLHNGQKFDLLSLGLLGVPALADHFNAITAKLQELKFDVSDYICIKFMLLLNPGELLIMSLSGEVMFRFVLFLFCSRSEGHHQQETRAGRVRASATGPTRILCHVLSTNPG